MILAALASAPASAFAGDLGPRSSGTISISITIPPHVVVGSAFDTEGGAGRSADAATCVSTNGFADYHLALLGGAEGSAAREMLPMSGSAGGERHCIAEAAPVQAASGAVSLRRAVTADAQSAPETLLIVPD